MKTINITSAEIESTIRKYSKGLKRVRFCVFVRAWLPTSEDKGFTGCALAHVSKKEFIRVCKDSLGTLELRGAKLAINVPEEDHGSFSI